MENKDYHIDLMFPSKYLRASDLPTEGVAFTITKINGDELKMVNGQSKHAYLLTLKEAEKQFVLNKTNAGAIAMTLGDKRAINWVGRRICLFPTQCDAFGKTVDCIRTRATQEQTPPQTKPAEKPLEPATEKTTPAEDAAAEKVRQTMITSAMAIMKDFKWGGWEANAFYSLIIGHFVKGGITAMSFQNVEKVADALGEVKNGCEVLFTGVKKAKQLLTGDEKGFACNWKEEPNPDVNKF